MTFYLLFTLKHFGRNTNIIYNFLFILNKISLINDGKEGKGMKRMEKKTREKKTKGKRKKEEKEKELKEKNEKEKKKRKEEKGRI